MGQKVHPGGFRVGVIHDWKSNWWTGKHEFSDYLLEDVKIRKHILGKLSHAGLSDILIRKDKQRITIDLVGTSSPDGPFPSVACRIQNELDAPGAVAWDTLAACTSFVYALSIADSFIATERADTVLVVGAEVLSRMLDYSDRGTAVIFGDGAGAAVVRTAPKGAGFLSWCLGSDGRGYAQVTAGNIEKGAYAAKDPAPFIDMVGPDVFKFAVDIFIRQATEVCQAAGVGLDEIDLWVPHQANFRIIDAAARRIGLPIERVAVNIDEYGNTSSASIPLALEEAIRNGRVKPGDHVLLAGFGSGLTWGATLLKWA